LRYGSSLLITFSRTFKFIISHSPNFSSNLSYLTSLPNLLHTTSITPYHSPPLLSSDSTHILEFHFYDDDDAYDFSMDLDLNLKSYFAFSSFLQVVTHSLLLLSCLLVLDLPFLIHQTSLLLLRIRPFVPWLPSILFRSQFLWRSFTDHVVMQRF